MSERDLYTDIRDMNPKQLEEYYQGALDRFVGRLKDDPNIIAVILAGSFAYDKVWYRSDMDMAILVRDQRLDLKSYSLDEDGIIINAGIYTRTEFRQMLQKTRGGGAMHSMYAKAKVVYTTDESIYEFLSDAQQMGADDIELSFFTSSVWLLGLMEKVEKWIVVKDNPMYAQFYILKCAEALADLYLIAKGLPPNRESVIRVLDIDEEFMAPFYRLPLSRELSKDEVYAILKRMNDFLEQHIDLISAPALRALEDGEVKTASMLDKRFSGRALYHVFDFLAERGVLERVTQTIRITPKGKKNVEEVAYMYIGDMLL